MKITNHNLNQISAAKPEATSPSDKTSQSSDTGAVEKRDRAVLSEQARIMLNAKSRLGEISTQDSERLETLRKAVETGNYEVPVDKLAHILASRLKNI
jgi:flagellar biosynthesis anti-sigma factor FlgM